MGWSLSEEGGSKYQVQKSAGDGTRFKVRVRRSLTPQSDLNLCQLCPELCRDLDVYKLLMLVHFILFFNHYLCLITNILCHCLPWGHWLVLDGGGRLNQTVVHWTCLID